REGGLVRENDAHEPPTRAIPKGAPTLLADRERAVERDRPLTQRREYVHLDAVLVIVKDLHRVLIGVRKADAQELEDAARPEVEVHLFRLGERVRIRSIADHGRE